MDVKLSAMVALFIVIVFLIEFLIFVLPVRIQMLRSKRIYEARKMELEHKFIDETASVKCQMAEALKENAELKQHYDEVRELEQRVQSEIQNALETNPMWGFPEQDAFPGSISVNSRMAKFSDDNTYGIIQGRVVLSDDIADGLIACKSNASRAEYILTYFHKLGILNRLVLQMLRSGCVELTCGYDKENGIEVYYSVQMKRSDNVVTYNLPSEKE